MNGPIHFYDRGFQPPRISCGRRAGAGRYTPEPAKISCYDCARKATGLTVLERDEAWENANDRLGRNKRSPWADEAAKLRTVEAP